MRIKMGDGYKVIAQGMCKGKELNLGAIQLIINTLIFDLEGMDAVLGVS